MSYTLYDASIAVTQNILQSLTDVLKIGEASSQAANLPEARIHPDMLPLTFQVHFLSDLAQKLAARTQGQEPQQLENNLKTFDDMYKRIAMAQELVNKADKETINSRVGETVNVGMGKGKTVPMSSGEYVNAYAMPNLFFHATTAYNILRKEGVDVGKMNYLTPFLGKLLPKQE